MVDIRIAGTANLTQMRAQFKAMQAQVAELNATLAETSMVPGRVNPAGYAQMQRMAAKSSQVWRDALSSSGQFTTQQLKLNSATETYTQLLKKEKLSLRQLIRQRAIGAKAYKEQIALQNMIVRENPMSSGGRRTYDIATPTNITNDLNTVGKKLGWIRAQTASASRMMINWGKNTQWAGRQLMVGFTMPVAAFGAAAGIMAYSVDKELTRVQKVYDTTAVSIAGNAKSMEAVETELSAVRVASLKTATSAAREYGAAATDTLKVQADLAATGLKGNSLQSSTTQVMRISALGELDTTSATQTAIALQTAFKLSTNQLTEAFNFMNATENATSLSIKDIAEATPRAASAMSELGVSVKQMTVMLVSMKESGVDAAEAANALKSATGTILAPSPAADKFIQQISNGRVQVTALAEASQGNLYVALQKLHEQMMGLSDLQKQQILVKLFGKYQFNRVSAMLNNLGDAWDGTQNQSHKAMELMGKDSKSLADIADFELSRFQKSASGKFKIALESVKIELAKMGDPFLEIGSKALSMIEGIAKGFNKLPDSLKHFIAGGAIFMAAVGPIIMLIGLFANFAGNLGLTAAAMLGLISKFNILNKEEWAQKKISDLAESGFMTQAKAAEILSAQINALTLSAQAALKAVSALSGAPAMGFIGPMNRPVIGPQVGGGPTQGPQRLIPVAPPTASVMAATNNMPQPTGPFAGYVGNAKALGPLTYEQTISQQLGPRRQNGKLLSDQLRVEQAIEKTEAQILAATEAQTKIRMEAWQIAEKDAATAAVRAEEEAALSKAKAVGNKAMNGAAVGTAAMAVSMGLMMGTSNKVANDIGKFLMIASIGVPAMKGLALVTKAVALRTAAAATAAWGEAAALTASAGAGNRLAGSLALSKAAGSGVVAGFKAMISPLGLATMAVTAIGVGIYAWEKHQQAIYDAQVKAQKALSSSTEDWANAAGKVVRQFERIQQASLMPDTSNGPTFDERVAVYNSPDMKDSTQAITDMSADEQKAFMLQKYIDLQNRSNLSAVEAAQEIKAMMVAAGSSYNEADIAAKNLYDTLGTFTDGDLTISVDANIDLLNYDNADTMKSSAQDLADVWGEAFRKSKSPEEAQALMDRLNGVAQSGFDNLYSMLSTQGKKEFDAAGVDSIEAFYKAIKATGDDHLKIGIQTGGYGVSIDDIYAAASSAGTMEQEIAKAVSSSSELSQTYSYINDMFTDIAIQSKTMNRDEAVKTAQKYNDALLKGYDIQAATGFLQGNSLSDLSKEQEQRTLIAMNIINANQGIKEGESPADALYNLLHDVRVETQGASDAANDFGNNLANVKFNSDDYLSMWKDAIAGVQDDLANMATDQFQNKMDDAIAAAQKGWDDKVSAQEARQQAAQDAFDKRWERKTDAVTKYYDDRIKKNDEAIKAEQKAEDIRQAIFDAEMQRIDRLNAAANQNIDFNIALDSGNFDEAAKLRNDMQSQADAWTLQDAKDQGANKSAHRVDRLNNNNDQINAQKDKALKALKEQEDAERKHLEKIQKMRADALKEQADANMQFIKDDWDQQKAANDAKIELFQSLPAANQKQLLKALKQAGITLDGFGTGTIDPTSQKWGKFFQDALLKHIRVAGAKIKSDHMWQDIGKKSARDLIGGALDMSMGQFKHWMKTGEFKTGGYNPDQSGTARQPNNDGYGPQLTYHTGGFVGETQGSRKGVARSMKGIHSSEQMILAQKGEFLVNRRDASEHAGVLQAMNSGRLNVGNGEGGAGVGIAGIMAAIVGGAMKATLSRGLKAGIARKRAETTGVSGLVYGPGTAGMYSDRSFSTDQLKNAATIASVGADMGMSKRDIEIGIMTAITESGLTNVQHGDRDSLGLFQQRPSQGWGTPAEVTDPIYASKKFFEALKGITGRGSMTPWAAAQAVQRSAYDDGSNYAQYWDNATAIYNNGLAKDGNAYTAIASSVTPGGGGWRKPSVPGKGWVNTHDYRNGLGSPLYAYNDGVVIDSRAITSGGSPGNGLYPTPYTSYGETIAIRGDDGNIVRYAHLSPGKRFVNTGDRVTGGTLIGLSGQTGNASGPHTHFDVNGNYHAMEFFRDHGIGLKTGGVTATDGIANLHKNEVVVDPNRTKDLFGNLDALTALFQSGWSIDPLLAMFGNMNPSVPAQSNDEVRTGTYNVEFSSENARSKTDLKRLMKDADVLGLTEMSGHKKNLLSWINEQGWGTEANEGDSVLIWNRAVLDLIKGGSRLLNNQTTPDMGGQKRFATYGLFKNKQSGSEFWQIAAHTIPRPSSDNAHRSVQDEQFGNLEKLHKELSSDGKPVFVVGDLNQDLRRGKINLGGLKSNWAGNMKNGNYTEGHSYLDHIMSAFGPNAQQVIRGLSSDHNAVLAQYNIPQFKAGGFIMSGGLARLHDDEMVASKPITKNIVEGAKNFASGGNSEYNVEVNLYGTELSVDDVTKAVRKAIKKEEARKPGSRVG